MLAAIIAHDKPEHLKVRMANREAHLAHFQDAGCMVTAGPFLDAKGDMSGSLIILDVPNLAAAQALSNSDPYVKAGLFSSRKVTEWKKVVG